MSNMYPKEGSYFGIFVKDQVEALEKLGVRVVRVVRVDQSILSYIPFMFKSILGILFIPHDVIHAHYGFHSALFAVIFGRRPVIITFHRGDIDEPWRNRLYYYLQRFVISRAACIIAVSNEVKNSLAEDLGAEAKKISLISCGVDSNYFAPIGNKQKLREHLGLPSNRPLILSVGTVSYNKGIDIIFRCAELLPETTFVVIGKGSKQSNVSNCLLVGPRPHEEIRLWMNAADLFLLPSRIEGLPVVLLEACACELPVIAAAVGGIPDVIVHGENGFIVRTHDPEDYATVIRELLLDEEQRKRAGKKTREFVREHYDNAVIARRILSIYKCLA